MNNIPSQSISKPVLFATPFFLFVLAVLHASSELSYMFVLNYINNVAGSADITFLPTTKPEVSHADFNRDLFMSQYGLQQPGSAVLTEGFRVPLLNVQEIEEWAKLQSIVEGVSPRWMMPSRMGNTDTILMVMDTARELGMGMGEGMTLEPMSAGQVAVEASFLNKMNLELGDVMPISMKPSNILSGLKLFKKMQDQSSQEEYDVNSGLSTDPKELAKQIYQALDLSEDQQQQISQQEFIEGFALVYDEEATVEYTVKQSFYPSGLYPSTLHNVIIMEQAAFAKLLTAWVLDLVTDINSNKIDYDIQALLPEEYQVLWPTTKLQMALYAPQIEAEVNKVLGTYSLIMVARLKYREEVYYPHGGIRYNQFATTLEQVPATTEVVVLYPFYKLSLAIKFFFDSVVQIFEFVTCIIFFYTITLIMKQIYEEKEIEVGIWRSLGAGGHPQRKQQSNQIEMNEASIGNNKNTYRSQFEAKLEFSHQYQFYKTLLVKVGYVKYWVTAVAASVVIYCFIKFVLYVAVTSRLHFNMIPQPVSLPFILFFLVLGFIEWVSIMHIRHILTHPLSETIKPVKRTFDVVKIRVIHIATFGISVEMLLIAIMLIYYGVVSYYWIPFSVLDNNVDLQIVLLNSIFIFMIFGAIILISILQSKLETAILWVFFRFNKKMRSMKLAILKNVKAKEYKNIKVTIIISLIFAFVLFFTAGIAIEIQIVESFINRALGANLVFENYEDKTFNSSLISSYLDQQPDIKYSWLSKDLSRGDYQIALISHISGEELDPEFQVLTSQYLNTTFVEYYYPKDYLSAEAERSYWELPNGLHDGFNSIYTGINGSESVGRYDPLDTITQLDPKRVNLENPDKPASMRNNSNVKMAPREQVVNMVVSDSLLTELGVKVGDYYKMKIRNLAKNIQFVLRCRVVHSFKAGPGFDILHDEAFISSSQAEYIYENIQAREGQIDENQKLYVAGSDEALKQVANKILSMSPDHTDMFEIGFVSQSFALLTNSLNGYVVGITAIMSCLAVLFLFLYTLGKCREEAEMYKMLRAIGLSCFDIRLMVFTQVMVRLFVAIANGIILGIVLSIGFSLQIEEFLMIKTPPIDPSIVLVIAVILLAIFGVTIVRATAYLANRTVATTSNK